MIWRRGGAASVRQPGLNQRQAFSYPISLRAVRLSVSVCLYLFMEAGVCGCLWVSVNDCTSLQMSVGVCEGSCRCLKDFMGFCRELGCL